MCLIFTEENHKHSAVHRYIVLQNIQNNTRQLLRFSSTIQTSQIGCNWPIKFVYKLENDTALCKISFKPS
jgi:hypothetical protein